jgi:uncharacterized protein YbjT (DUF2867 family)
MRVFVTGGTGAVGRHTIPALVPQGRTVTALARTREKAAALTAQQATPVAVSLCDRSALTAVFVGHDTVVNLATAIPPMTRWMSAAALRAPAGTFNVVDDEPLTKWEYAEALACAAGKRMWLRGPGWAPRYPSAREGWIATATALKHSRVAV